MQCDGCSNERLETAIFQGSTTSGIFNLHMNEEVSLKHKLIDLAALRHDLLSILWEKE